MTSVLLIILSIVADIAIGAAAFKMAKSAKEMASAAKGMYQNHETRIVTLELKAA